MMKIYFAGSIRGGRLYADIYLKIVSHLQAYGQVLTEVVANQSLTKADNIPKGCDKAIHDQDIQWLLEADVIIAECTQPSLGVGYELGRAIENNKQTLVLFMSNNHEGTDLSCMIRGAERENFIIKEYTNPETLPEILDDYLRSISFTKEYQ